MSSIKIQQKSHLIALSDSLFRKSETLEYKRLYYKYKKTEIAIVTINYDSNFKR